MLFFFFFFLAKMANPFFSTMYKQCKRVMGAALFLKKSFQDI